MQIDDLHDEMKKVRRERDEWREKLDRVLPDDSLMQYERIRHSTEIFEEVRSSLERQLAQAKMEIQRLVAAMQRLHMHTVDASTQVMLAVGDGQVQTDLSYQQADHLQGDRWRRDRLDSLKRASNFVDDQDERRDFTVIMRTTAPPVAQLGYLAWAAATHGYSICEFAEDPGHAAKLPQCWQCWTPCCAGEDRRCDKLIACS
eukprot:s482_g12.t1